MSRKAFTLLELMVVVAIMAAMATLSVNGYRALTKGMQDRSAIVAVQTLVDAARQRAEIDRKPMLVYFYDELLQEADETKGADLIGHGVAVAIRPIGRISAIDGNFLCDEFGDLDQIYAEENQQSSDDGVNQQNRTAMRFYRLADGNYADVKPSVVNKLIAASYLLTGESIDDVGVDDGDSGDGKMIRCFAFEKVGGNAGFHVGDVYGGEFASVTLPNGYYFGQSAPSAVERRKVGEPMEIKPTAAGSSGAKAVTVYSMKAGSNTLDPVGTTKTGGN
jgi:prepilin-type N-terminal cleavage/methylation domain-containing protein